MAPPLESYGHAARRHPARRAQGIPMTAMTFSTRWTHAVGGAFALSTLVFATACNTAPQATQASAQQAAAQGTPVVVSCEPHQRTLVRPAVVNGVTVSQVECVAAANVQSRPWRSPGVRAGTVGISVSVRVVRVAGYSESCAAQVVPVQTNQLPALGPTNQGSTKSGRSGDANRGPKAPIIRSSAGAGAGVGSRWGTRREALIGAGRRRLARLWDFFTDQRGRSVTSVGEGRSGYTGTPFFSVIGLLRLRAAKRTFTTSPPAPAT